MSFRRRSSFRYNGAQDADAYQPPYMARGQSHEASVDIPGFYKSKSVSQAFGDDFRPDPNAQAGSQQDMQNFVGAIRDLVHYCRRLCSAQHSLCVVHTVVHNTRTCALPCNHTLDSPSSLDNATSS